MTVEGPRTAVAEEFDDVVELVDRCFGFDDVSVTARMPHCFDAERTDRHAVVVVDGEIVSHVACTPVRLVAGPAEVECCGIAGVATDEDHRGNGYMDDLLAFWLERLAEREIPLAELEGDRIRYGRYGWENAGREYRYSITSRSLPDRPPDEGAIERYDGSARQLEEIERLHETERFRVRRDRRAYETVLEQAGLETVLRSGDEPAYACYRRRETAPVLEFGGTEPGVRSLLARVLDAPTVEDLTVYAHPRHPSNGLFRRISADWSMIPHRKLNVLDLRATLEAFEPLVTERWRRARTRLEGSVVLGIEDKPAAELSYDPSGVTVRSVDRDPDVSLTRLEAVRFLFGFPDQWREVRRRDPLLEAAFPLEYYFWETETI